MADIGVMWRRLKFKWRLARPITKFWLVSGAAALVLSPCLLYHALVDYRSRLPSIVCLRVTLGEEEIRYGTGVLIRSGSALYVLSVGHLVTEEPFPFLLNLPEVPVKAKYELRLSKDKYAELVLLKLDAKRDLSLFQVKAPTPELRRRALSGFGELARPVDPGYGSELYAIGFAFGPSFPHHLQSGRQSLRDPKNQGEFRRPMPWTDVSAADMVFVSGMSGSPVMTRHGRIVGLAAGSYCDSISFYIPNRSIQAFLAEWASKKTK